MTPEENLELSCKIPQFLVVTGSRLYGTYRTDDAGNIVSDTDLRGWTLPPWEYLTNNPQRKFYEKEIASPPLGDHKISSLNKFLEDLARHDPVALELLFVPPEHIRSTSAMAQELLSLREMFISKQFYWRISGYSNSEWRKCRAVKLEIQEPPKSLDEIKAWIRKSIQPPKVEMDKINEWLTSHLTKTEVSSLAGINGKRKEEYAKYGYCTSSACHSVRLMFQCKEFLETGVMTFPRPEAHLLRDIKHGRMKIEDITTIYEEAKAKCDEAFAKSTLPEKIETGKIWKWYEKVLKEKLKSDCRLQYVAKS